jgi:hypothetical protein
MLSHTQNAPINCFHAPPVGARIVEVEPAHAYVALIQGFLEIAKLV